VILSGVRQTLARGEVVLDMARRPIETIPTAEMTPSAIEESSAAGPRRGASSKMKPTVILVGADKGGVGKTTVARAVADYLMGKNIPLRAFDTEIPRGTLKRFHGDITETVDIASTADQMRILDTLNTAQVLVSLIDTRAGALAQTLRVLRDIGFFDAVHAGQFNFILLHVLGASIASLDEIAETAPFVANAYYFLVKNYVNETTFFEWDPETYMNYFAKSRSADEISIPKLSEMAYEQVDIAGSPFSAFIANKTADGRPASHSFVLRGYVRTWQRKIADEFDRIGLIDLVTDGSSKS
jgi:hypothetical protein